MINHGTWDCRLFIPSKAGKDSTFNTPHFTKTGFLTGELKDQCSFQISRFKTASAFSQCVDFPPCSLLFSVPVGDRWRAAEETWSWQQHVRWAFFYHHLHSFKRTLFGIKKEQISDTPIVTHSSSEAVGVILRPGHPTHGELKFEAALNMPTSCVCLQSI